MWKSGVKKRTTKATQLSKCSSSVKREDSESLLRTAETLKGELERLQLLNERLHGER